MNRWAAQAMHKRMKEKKVSKKVRNGMFEAFKIMQARRQEEDDQSRQAKVSIDSSMEEIPGEDS